jgi:hypothetical protein
MKLKLENMKMKKVSVETAEISFRELVTILVTTLDLAADSIVLPKDKSGKIVHIANIVIESKTVVEEIEIGEVDEDEDEDDTK